MVTICVDSGFLIALYDLRDSHHEHASKQFNSFFAPESFRHVLLAPWPILYESLNTRQARRKPLLQQLSADWNILERNEQLILLNDATYRDQALRDYLEIYAEGPRTLSLADRVIRAVLADPANLIDALLTYNARDFSDVCTTQQIQLIDQHFESLQLMEP
jgi:predicted nucleic acid-binding protein